MKSQVTINYHNCFTIDGHLLTSEAWGVNLQVLDSSLDLDNMQ